LPYSTNDPPSRPGRQAFAELTFRRSSSMEALEEEQVRSGDQVQRPAPIFLQTEGPLLRRCKV
jgi:hypothetical protein